jgi:hypothetical protein
MEQRVSPKEYPWWVKLSLLGVPGGRAGQWACVAVSLLLAAGAVYLSQSDARARPFTLVAIAALPYWLSIRWVDRHGSWSGDAGADSGERS